MPETIEMVKDRNGVWVLGKRTQGEQKAQPQRPHMRRPVSFEEIVQQLGSQLGTHLIKTLLKGARI